VGKLGRLRTELSEQRRVTYEWLALPPLLQCSQLDGAVASWPAASASYICGSDEQDQPEAEPTAERVADQAAHSSPAALAVAACRRSVRVVEAVGVMVTKDGRSRHLISYVQYSTEPADLAPARAMRRDRLRPRPGRRQARCRPEGGRRVRNADRRVRRADPGASRAVVGTVSADRGWCWGE
jgi:hypothetical protein